MIYEMIVKDGVAKQLQVLRKRNSILYEKLHKKVNQICHHPYHRYKILKKPMQHLQRVHIDKSFVLVFKVNHQSKTVELLRFEHHDKVYL